MKLDKETIIVLAVTGIILICWFIFYPEYVKSNAERQAAQESLVNQDAGSAGQPAHADGDAVAEKAAGAAEKSTAEVVSGSVAENAEAAADAVREKVPAAEGTVEKKADSLREKAEEKKAILEKRTSVLENGKVRITFDELKGTVRSVDFLKYKKNVDSRDSESIRFTAAAYNLPDTLTLDYGAGNTLSGEPVEQPVAVKTTTGAGEQLVLERRLAGGLLLIHTFVLKNDSYELLADVEIRSADGVAHKFDELKTWVAGFPPMPALSSDKLSNIKQSVEYCLLDGDVESVDPEPDPDDYEDFKEEETSRAVSWIGAANNYFASFLFPDDSSKFTGGIRLEQKAYTYETMKSSIFFWTNGRGNAECAVPAVCGVVPGLEVSPEKPAKLSYLLYCGPKELNEVAALEDSTVMDAMHMATWSWFEFITQPLARFLNWLYSYLHSYGLAIIVLTLIVRLICWPVTQKANNSMRKMQKLQPQMNALREKYKDNQQELSARMMQLYRDEKVSPLGGCLPMLVQLPVFFALYSVFGSAVELRHVSFLWAADLAQPDVVYVIPGINLPVHPFILMMTGLMILQQKISSPAAGADPMQQKMMAAMPLIMLFMLYDLPSGLTLYWTVSQLFSILQMKLGQYMADKEEKNNSGKSENESKKKNKASAR